MNEVFLIGKVVTDIEFKFVINSKKKKSIVRFEIKTIDEQLIKIVAYNEIADFMYSKIKKEDIVFIYGEFNNNTVNIRSIEKL